MKFLVIGGVVFAVIVAMLLINRARQRHAAVRRLCDERGWTSVRDSKATVVTPADGSWTLTMTRASGSQHSSKPQLVTTTWSVPSPRTRAGAMIVGPTPPEPLRALAVQLIGSIQSNGKVAGWLGLTKVTDGAPLQHLPSVDARLLGLATDDAPPVGPLTAAADAIDAWCGSHSGEREQPAVTFDGDGVRVRVRVDVRRSADQLSAFVDLGLRCAGALNSVGS